MKRAERLTVSALTGLSNLLETLGAEGKSVLDLVFEDDAIGGASQSLEVGSSGSTSSFYYVHVLKKTPQV